MRSVVNSCFVAVFPPSGGPILAIFYTLYGLCQIKPLDCGTYSTKTAIFCLHPPPMSIETYSFLYFYLCTFCGCGLLRCLINGVSYRPSKPSRPLVDKVMSTMKQSKLETSRYSERVCKGSDKKIELCSE